MELKVYISVPCVEHAVKRKHEIEDKIYSLVDKTRINVNVLNSGPSAVERFNGLSEDVDKLLDADFVIFDVDWKSDCRCRAEMELVAAHDIPWTYTDMLDRTLINFAVNAFKIDIPKPEPQLIEGTRSALISLASLLEDSCDIPQSVFVIEGCSELITGLTKGRREKGSKIDVTDVLSGAYDVLTSTLILLIRLHISEGHICDQIIGKCNRAIRRFKETGEF